MPLGSLLDSRRRGNDVKRGSAFGTKRLTMNFIPIVANLPLTAIKIIAKVLKFFCIGMDGEFFKY
jgi:hypothetical protein